MTRILHTADWHLGARLIDCDRYDEHVAFLAWLRLQVETIKPDLLIVAGDIFDAANPPQEALRLYYQFLSYLVGLKTCHTLILGGNHDSPALLHAPRELLHAMNVRVIASPGEMPDDCVWEFGNIVVCAVPYLRERYLRTAQAGQTAQQIAEALRAGVNRHYREILTAAQSRAAGRPILCTGHLTVVGSTTTPSERIIHIGSLGAVGVDCFAGFAYTALGHLHRPQMVADNGCVRYAGSPLPLSFAEVDGDKEIRIIDLGSAGISQQGIAVPLFRPLLRITVEIDILDAELRRIDEEYAKGAEPWLELTVTDGRAHPDLDQQVRLIADKRRLRILKIQLPVPAENPAAFTDSGRALQDFQPAEVFAERLRREQIALASPEETELTASFAELLSGMAEEQTREVHP